MGLLFPVINICPFPPGDHTMHHIQHSFFFFQLLPPILLHYTTLLSLSLFVVMKLRRRKISEELGKSSKTNPKMYVSTQCYTL